MVIPPISLSYHFLYLSAKYLPRLSCLRAPWAQPAPTPRGRGDTARSCRGETWSWGSECGSPGNPSVERWRPPWEGCQETRPGGKYASSALLEAIEEKKKRRQVRSLPGEPFHNFRASRPGDRPILCSSGTSCDGFWSSKIVKGFVGYRNFRIGQQLNVTFVRNVTLKSLGDSLPPYPYICASWISIFPPSSWNYI